MNSPSPDPPTEAPPHPESSTCVRYKSCDVSPSGKPDSYVTNPSGTIMVWEHNNPSVMCTVGRILPAGHWDSGHSDGIMVMFCDGHVKRMPLGQLRIRNFTYFKDSYE